MNKDTVLLAKLGIGRWLGYRFDRSASDRMLDDYHAQQGAARVNKRLVPKAQFKQINAAYNGLRSAHTAMTLPWGDDEARILPVKLYMRYTERMRTAIAVFNQAADEFTMRYPQIVVDAEHWLEGLYNPDDYPPAETIRARFYVSLQIRPLPAAEDFRVDLAESEVTRLQEELVEHNRDTFVAATRAVWERVYEIVGRVRDTLSEDNKRFTHTLVDNVSDIVDLLPALNVTGDTDLESVRVRVQKELAGLSTEGLRQDKDHRADVAARADAIMQTMEEFMGVDR